MANFRIGILAVLVILSLLASSIPSAADTAGRPDDPTPDEIYYALSGPDYPEGKENLMGPMSAPATETVFGVGAAGAGLTTVTFPYVKSNWSITSWYSTGDGLRFYGVFYKNEQILWDYRVPWVGVNGIKRALSTQQLVGGPDLWVYSNADYFLVWAKYNLGNPNINVFVITRFYGDGTIEPWVLLDGGLIHYNFYVPQRFDFDLGGADDDNQQYYDGTGWKYSTTEHSTLDATFPESPAGYQWRDFDTDQSGTSYITDQEVDIKPYSSDGSRWYSLQYGAAEINGDPVNYLTGQNINTLVPGAADPWIGQDAVNWYVSTYTYVTIAYPGPWVKVFV